MADAAGIRYRAFLWKEQTSENGSLLIGGLCDETLLHAIEQRRRQLQPVSFADIHDAYDVDFRLSQYLEALGTDITILGASVFVPGTFTRSGGIIGSPSQSPTSASDAADLEALPDNFFLWTQPGGPGVAFRADRIQAEQIFEILKENHKTLIPQQTALIQALLDELQIAPYLIVCDGSGYEGYCWMAVSDGANPSLQSR